MRGYFGMWTQMGRGSKERRKGRRARTSKNKLSSKSKRNGGTNRKSNGGSQSKGKTQDRSKVSAFRRRRTVGRDASGKRRRAGGDGQTS